MHDWETRRQERWARRQERWAARGQAWDGRRPFGGLMVGILMIGGGLLFLLRNLGFVYFDTLWDFWPLILIFMGLSNLTSPRCRGGHIWGGVMMTGVGVIFLLRNFDIVGRDIWSWVWPAFFIVLGATMLLKHLYGPDWWSGAQPATVSAPDGPDPGPQSAAGANWLRADAMFGGVERRVTSQEFEGGRVSVMFGGAEIDLRGAATKLSNIRLHLDAIFGGIELRVPDTWRVDARGSGVFGSYEDLTQRPTSSDAPVLTVTGGAVFGGVTIRN